jgi:xylulokinase
LRYIAAYDLGTSGLKLSLIDDFGHAHTCQYAPYSLLECSSAFAEQNPTDYWNAVCVTTKRMLEQGSIAASDISAVVFCTQWKAIIPTDAQGNALANAIIWLDHRALEQAQRLNVMLGTSVYIGSDYLSKIMWLKENRPDIWERTACVMDAGCYLKYKACGTITCDLTSHFTRSFSALEQRQIDDVMRLADISADKFPPLVSPEDIVGFISRRAARETGLAEGTPVMGGCGDIPAITLGIGAAYPGSAHIYMGSSGWFAATCSCDSFWPGTRLSNLAKDTSIRFHGLESVGLSARWIADVLYGDYGRPVETSGIRRMQQEIERIAAGSDGLFALPSLRGENPPLSANVYASFVNLRACHTRAHIARAMLESICFYMRLFRDDYEAWSGMRLHEIAVCGGCADNPDWMRMMSDVLGTTIRVPVENGFTGARGGALFALKGLGADVDPARWTQRVDSFIEYRPDLNRAKEYERLYPKFRLVLGSMTALHQTLN